MAPKNTKETEKQEEKAELRRQIIDLLMPFTDKDQKKVVGFLAKQMSGKDYEIKKEDAENEVKSATGEVLTKMVCHRYQGYSANRLRKELNRLTKMTDDRRREHYDDTYPNLSRRVENVVKKEIRQRRKTISGWSGADDKWRDHMDAAGIRRGLAVEREVDSKEIYNMLVEDTSWIKDELGEEHVALFRKVVYAHRHEHDLKAVLTTEERNRWYRKSRYAIGGLLVQYGLIPDCVDPNDPFNKRRGPERDPDGE